MKRALLCLLPLVLGACNPFPKDEDEAAAAQKKVAQPTATPKPTPAPGSWMREKRENPLEKKAYH